MAILVSWRNLALVTEDIESFNIYRDLNPFTTLTLPAILVSLNGKTEFYRDEDVDGSSIYYYMIEVVSSTSSAFSALVAMSEIDALLWDNIDELSVKERILLEDNGYLLLEVRND